MAITALACTSESERAADIATARVRDSAARTLALLEENAASPKARRGQELVDEIRQRLSASADVIIFDTDVDHDGSVTLRIAFHARGESGGGLRYEAVVARLCVVFTAELGSPPVAEMRDAGCPRRMPDATGHAGKVDLTVRLRG